MSGYTVLACPACGAKASLQAGTTYATASSAAASSSSTPPWPLPLNPRQSPPLPSTPCPPASKLTRPGSDLTLTHRWFSPKYIFLAFFTVFWDAFLIFWFGMAFGMEAPLFFTLFPLLHLAVGVYLTYSTLAGFVNTTTIHVTPNRFSVAHGPLPWPGGLDLPAADLRQLYVREVVQHSRRSTRVTYTLSAVLAGGRAVDLLKGLDRPETGRYIEQQVESFLRTPDAPVGGEMEK